MSIISAEVTNILPEPTKEQATHWMRAVDLPDAAIGACLTATAGQSPRHLTSLIMIEAFLNPIDEVTYDNLHDTINYVNPRGLAQWIRNTISDSDLADAVAKIAEDDRAYGFQIRDIKPLIGERLKQYAHACSAEPEQPQNPAA
jgi:hypothetical protein